MFHLLPPNVCHSRWFVVCCLLFVKHHPSIVSTRIPLREQLLTTAGAGAGLIVSCGCHPLLASLALSAIGVVGHLHSVAVSACNPPYEQWLAAVGVGADLLLLLLFGEVSCCGWVYGVLGAWCLPCMGRRCGRHILNLKRRKKNVSSTML
jgi:hypothetical protein